VLFPTFTGVPWRRIGTSYWKNQYRVSLDAEHGITAERSWGVKVAVVLVMALVEGDKADAGRKEYARNAVVCTEYCQVCGSTYMTGYNNARPLE
jgi:hypothetical protein